jgi:hypothetical protein
MVIGIDLIICIVGLLMYALSNTNPKISEIGRIMFAFGLLALLLSGPQIVGLVAK